VGRALKNDGLFRQFTAWVRVKFLIFNFGENHPLDHILGSGTDFRLIKHLYLQIPHIKLECVDLCGLGGVGGLCDPHRVPASRKKACFTR
jgi:hypothetical protein